MKIPKNLKIGAQKIRVSFPKIVRSQDEEVLGISSASVGKIKIAKNYHGDPCPEDSLADTFLYEIIHIVNANFGIELKENQVAGVAGSLLMVIRDNGLDFR